MLPQVMSPPAMQKTQGTWVQFLGWEDPLEKEMAIHSSILAWRIPCQRSLVYTPECHKQFSSVTQSCPTLCDPINRSTPGFPFRHWLPEFTQTYVHQVGDAIQPSHPLSNPSPPAFNLSQHQGLFKWVSSSHQVAKILEFQLQHQSFSEYSGLISFRMDWLDLLAVQGTLKSLLQHHSSKASFYGALFSL